jgi:hypothetical protein
VSRQTRRLELAIKKDGWRGFVETLIDREMRGEVLEERYLQDDIGLIVDEVEIFMRKTRTEQMLQMADRAEQLEEELEKQDHSTLMHVHHLDDGDPNHAGEHALEEFSYGEYDDVLDEDALNSLQYSNEDDNYDFMCDPNADEGVESKQSTRYLIENGGGTGTASLEDKDNQSYASTADDHSQGSARSEAKSEAKSETNKSVKSDGNKSEGKSVKGSSNASAASSSASSKKIASTTSSRAEAKESVKKSTKSAASSSAKESK